MGLNHPLLLSESDIEESIEEIIHILVLEDSPLHLIEEVEEGRVKILKSRIDIQLPSVVKDN